MKNAYGIKTAFPMLIWKMESTPTPYTVAVSPYVTVWGRTLSTSSGAETRRMVCPGSALLSKFAAAARMSTVPDFTPVMCPALSTVAILGSLLVHTNATLGIATERSEERRVGKEWRSRWSTDQGKK